MPTLILTPRFTEDAQALWRAAGRLGWDVERLTSWSVPPELLAVEEPVVYLEGLFGPTLADQLGITLTEVPEDWLPRLPWEYRRRHVERMRLGEARRLEEPRFVKPPNEKSFPAGVYTGATLPSEYDDEMSVLVADVVAWEMEFRCFLLDRKLRTMSIYLRHGELQRANDFANTEREESAVRAFLDKVLADSSVELPRAAVVDVGVIEGQGWAVVEQNAAWGSGIYGCDPEQVLAVLRHASVRESQR